MRHGEAEAHAASDAKRELTAEGRQDITQMVADYAEALQQVDVIWVSPYVRAQQTAALVSESLSKPIVIKDFLPPNGNPSHVLDALEDARQQTVLMVSHQPLIGILVDNLAGLEPGRYRMGTGSLACLSTDVYANNCCALEWLYQPASTQASVYS